MKRDRRPFLFKIATLASVGGTLFLASPQHVRAEVSSLPSVKKTAVSSVPQTPASIAETSVLAAIEDDQGLVIKDKKDEVVAKGEKARTIQVESRLGEGEMAITITDGLITVVATKDVQYCQAVFVPGKPCPELEENDPESFCGKRLREMLTRLFVNYDRHAEERQQSSGRKIVRASVGAYRPAAMNVLSGGWRVKDKAFH